MQIGNLILREQAKKRLIIQAKRIPARRTQAKKIQIIRQLQPQEVNPSKTMFVRTYQVLHRQTPPSPMLQVKNIQMNRLPNKILRKHRLRKKIIHIKRKHRRIPTIRRRAIQRKTESRLNNFILIKKYCLLQKTDST